MRLNVLIKSMRLPFVVLSPICVFLGVSTVIAHQGEVDLFILILAIIGGLFAAISVNVFNEYLDFKSGLDLITKRTLFSGGSGALPANPTMYRSVFGLGILTLLLTLAVGAVVIYFAGLVILPIGILGVLLIVLYTGWLNKKPILCLVSPGLGYGVLMVIGSQVALEGEYTMLPFCVALLPFFLTNNLLLLNQYPDIEADITVGRNHLAIAYGTTVANWVYGFFAIAALVAIILPVAVGYFPPLSLIALLPMPLAFYALYGAIKHQKLIGQHLRFLTANVAVSILSPLLLGVSLIYI